MIRLALRLLLALLGEGLCERIRPTKRYTLGGYMKINDGPWHWRKSATILRRPWQRHPNVPMNPVSMMPLMDGTVQMQGPAVYPEDE